MKVSKLVGPALDWAVGVADGVDTFLAPVEYSSKWVFGGPIIAREGISIVRNEYGLWVAGIYNVERNVVEHANTDPDSLVAAMRTFVASKVGPEINIPDVLA